MEDNSNLKVIFDDPPEGEEGESGYLSKVERQVLRNFGLGPLQQIGGKHFVPAGKVAELLSRAIPVFSKKTGDQGLYLNWTRENLADPDLEVMGFVIGPFKLPKEAMMPIAADSKEEGTDGI